MTDDDQDFAFLVESRLTGFGVYPTEFVETDEGYALTYESIAADQDGGIPHREVGRIVNVFRDVTDDPFRLEGTVTDMSGKRLGDWTAKREWLEALEAGEMTEVAFSERVIDAIDPVADEPQ